MYKNQGGNPFTKLQVTHGIRMLMCILFLGWSQAMDIIIIKYPTEKIK